MNKHYFPKNISILIQHSWENTQYISWWKGLIVCSQFIIFSSGRRRILYNKKIIKKKLFFGKVIFHFYRFYQQSHVEEKNKENIGFRMNFSAQLAC
jgi:hypothetical protein